jgi:sodium pump decarboxylase gamma subunit
MAIEGFKLAIIGITVVYFFLALVIGTIRLCARILRPITEKERLSIETVTSRSGRPPAASGNVDGRLIAVISAALAAHRARMRGR